MPIPPMNPPRPLLNRIMREDTVPVPRLEVTLYHARVPVLKQRNAIYLPVQHHAATGVTGFSLIVLRAISGCTWWRGRWCRGTGS